MKSVDCIIYYPILFRIPFAGNVLWLFLSIIRAVVSLVLLKL